MKRLVKKNAHLVFDRGLHIDRSERCWLDDCANLSHGDPIRDSVGHGGGGYRSHHVRDGRSVGLHDGFRLKTQCISIQIKESKAKDDLRCR